MNVNMKWRASLIYICIFIKGVMDKLSALATPHSGIEARSATDLWRTGYVDLFPPA